MNEALKQRLLSINPLRPYVWQLRLTEDDYLQLSDFVRSSPQNNTREYAILAMIYIAEWYKRDYDGNVSNPLEGVSAEKLWHNSGFSIGIYVYRSKKTLRYLESIYMLGGLPIRFILKRNNQKILKELCRLYKGDKSSLEDNPEIGRNQAVAFQKSINNKASVFYYLKTLLEDNIDNVYAESELKDKTSLPNQFIFAVKTAYEEVMRDKFQVEWLVEYNPASSYLKRKLRLHLRPEEIGGFNQYLRFDRAAIWHIPDLIKQRQLKVYVRFRNGKNIIGDEKHHKNLFIFENTGQDDTGFEASSDVPWATLLNVPSKHFTAIDVVVTNDSGKDYVVQKIPCGAEYIQLWKIPNEFYRWSSKRSTQNLTAVVYSDFYILSGTDFVTKFFYEKSSGLSEPWHFAFIQDHITLKHSGKPDISLWNREGYIQFMPKLYTDVLQYKEGKVRYLYKEDFDYFSEPESEEWYPALFRKEDIKVYHFRTKDALNAIPENANIQKIEFKPFNAANHLPYEQWTEEHQPPYGRIKLRLTIMDEEKIYPVLFLPSLLQQEYDRPIVRDYKNSRLIYADAQGAIKEEHIEIKQDFHPLAFTTPIITWENEQEQVVLDVFLPTLVKEIYLDGKLTRYLQEGEEFTLPYLLHNRVVIHDFNKEGYNEFQCLNIGDMKERGSLDKWISSDLIHTNLMTNSIPTYLKVKFGNTPSEGQIDEMIYWNYSTDIAPKTVETNYESQMDNYSILFQDMRNVRNDLLCVPPITHNDQAVGFGDFGAWEAFMNSTSKVEPKDKLPLLCFDFAIKYQTYFFIFNPLFNLSEEQFIQDIYQPLLERNDGDLNETDFVQLTRCATELGFDWENLQFYIDNYNKK